MLIFFNNTWRVFQSSSETPGPDHFQWQMAVAHGTKPSGGECSPLWHQWSRQQPLARFYTTGESTCAGPQLLNMPDRSGSVPSQRSISQRGASAIRQLQKGERSASPVKGHCQPRPPPRCDCCFKELSDSLTSLYSTAPTRLLCKLHLLPSPPRSFLLFSFLSHSD